MNEPKSKKSDERARRHRAERLLGGLLPDQTKDESADAWGDHEGTASRDEEIRGDVPPHHGA